jgi:serine phosphatase RsbU (regulator of sigma subunit)
MGLDPDQVVCYRESHRNFYVFTFILLSSVVGLVAFGLINQRRNNQKLEVKNNEISSQKALLENANQNIVASIRYASLIQSSFLPTPETISESFQNFFLLYKPKDVVSGDFYYCRNFGNKLVIALGDCTGHGVPGAFLTIRTLNLLENLVPEFLDDPNKLLDALHFDFNKTGWNPEVQLGLDLGVFIVDCETKCGSFSGANHSLFIEKGGDISELKGTRRGIGPGIPEDLLEFSKIDLDLNGDETFYLFSDGITDQFGGPKSKKIGKTKVLDWLKNSNSKNFSQKRSEIEERLTQWQGAEKQTDDICLMGFQLNLSSLKFINT